MILRRVGSGELVANDQLTQAQWDALAARFYLPQEVVLTGFCRRKCAMIEVTDWGLSDGFWGYHLKTRRSFAVEANGDVIKLVPADIANVPTDTECGCIKSVQTCDYHFKGAV